MNSEPSSIKNNGLLSFDHDFHQYEKSFMTSFYHNLMLKKCANLIKGKNVATALDFGCGKQRLKKFLPTTLSYEGFDLVEEFSSISLPFSQNYDCIFAIQLLMWLEENEISDLICKFHKHTKWLVVLVPSRNFLKDNILDRILNLKNNRENWVMTQPNIINSIISQKFSLQKKISFLALSEITFWKSNFFYEKP